MQAFLEIFDIYLLEAVINGILLGGVLALLALGLNLIFGVIDVTWICYAELVMIGMYGMYYLFTVYHVPYWVAAPICILLVAGLGAMLHFLVIEPLLSGPPINQLLATGGVLFVLQSFATVVFGIDFRNLGIRLPVLTFAEMHFSYSRLLAFGAADQFGPEFATIAGLLGGTLAAGSHVAKTGSRALINTSPEPFSNIAASLATDALVVTGLYLALTNPITFLCLLALFIALLVWLLPKLVRLALLPFRRLMAEKPMASKKRA